MTDSETIRQLIARDEAVTQQFFFGDCRPLFLSIIRHVFSCPVDYDEFVNEFYIYLMDDDARRLRQFAGRSSVYQWLKVVAIRYFVAKRHRMIDLQPKTALGEEKMLRCVKDNSDRLAAGIDICELLNRLSNRRYADILRRLVIEDAEPQQVAAEFRITVDNLYNLKKRALAALTAVVLEDIRIYERGY